MKYGFLLFFLSVLGLNAQTYEDTVRAYHKEQNDFYSNPKTSPLTEEDLKTFEGHPYYPINEEYRVVAEFIRIEDAAPFLMKTTTDRLPTYQLYGKARFTLQGKTFELELYKDLSFQGRLKYRDILFLPFTDLTNGDGSYGGGRYMNIKIPEGDTVVLDFNKTYHPYCVYNPVYSCPIPPAVNHLEVAIKAGVKLNKKK